MSEASESKFKSARFSTPIAEMAPWHFWADSYSLGLSAEDAAAIEDGTALPDQIDRALQLSMAARQRLIGAPHNEPIGKPS